MSPNVAITLRVMSPPRDNRPPMTEQKSQSHPRAFWFIFWGEFAERASYYGCAPFCRCTWSRCCTSRNRTERRSIRLQDGRLFPAAHRRISFRPLHREILEHRRLLRFPTYWAISSWGIENVPAMVLALSLLAIGSGVTKPNISTLLGLTYDQQRPGQEQLLSAAFRWFYLSINIGALISQFVMPVLRTNFSYRTAFQFPAWLMVGALIAFAVGKPYYAVEKPGPVSLTPAEKRQRWQTLKTLFGFFACVIFFWFGYEHNDSLWVYFADKHMNLTIDWLGVTVRGDQFQWINALCVICSSTIISLLASAVDPQQRIFTAYNRVLVGFVVTTLSIAIMSLAGFIAQEETKVSVLWIIWPTSCSRWAKCSSIARAWNCRTPPPPRT